MHPKVKVAIIGAGTAGISAFKEISQFTSNVVMIDPGPFGTTCARIGCMPSKVFLQIAEDFAHRNNFEKQGIFGGEKLRLDIPRALQHVRLLRDYFTSGVIRFLDSLGDQLIRGHATLLDRNTIEVERKIIQAEKIIIATGSHSIIPVHWQKHYEKQILTNENIFEQDNLPKKIAVIGAGVIGLELGQALHRFGIETEMFHARDFIGGLTDPKVNQHAIEIMKQQFPLHLCKRAEVNFLEKHVTAMSESHHFNAEKVLAAMGRAPNLGESLGLKNLDVKLDEQGIPIYDEATMQIGDSNLFIAGDVNTAHPLLHEAADDGRIAGYNAIAEKTECFQRRTPLAIIFCDPNIAVIGKRFQELESEQIVIGEVNFNDQGRSRILNKNSGLLRVYADKNAGRLLGAEMIAPRGEHIAHLLAFAISQQLTLHEILKMPYYHPTVEEGLRTALRQAASKLSEKKSKFELALCESRAAPSLS